MAQNYTLPLKSPQATIETVGGKGASLSRLLAAGLPVPDGFHVTTAAYRRFIAMNGLQEKVLAAAAKATLDEPEALEDASRQINGFFMQNDIPEDVAEAIRKAYAGLGGGDLHVAVRSSATAEDLPGMSFAGQMETYLNVHGETIVLEMVKRCWTSLWMARAISYRVRNDIPHDDLSMAVVVQKLVPADAAGIMFTANPVTGALDQVVINASWGLGEAIVEGKVTPDTIVVGKLRRKIIEQQINQKDVMTVRTSKGTHEQPVPSSKRGQAVLGPVQASKLARIGIKVENLYCMPMDIEWVLERGRFFLVQARPITNLHGHNPLVGEYNESLCGDFLWSKGDAGEAITDVMTPCTWSLLPIMFDEAVPVVGSYRQYGNIGGRLYVNLTIFASILGPKRFTKLSEKGMGRFPEGMQIHTIPIPWLSLLSETLPWLLRVIFRSRAYRRRMPDFLRTAPGRCEDLRTKIQAASTCQELLALWDYDVKPLHVEACRTWAAVGLQGMISAISLPEKLNRMVGEKDADALLSGSVGDWGHLASLGLMLSLAKLSRGEIGRNDFSQMFGHRGPHEFEVSMPRPGEDPQWIDQQLAALNEAKIDVDKLLARKEAARQEAWNRLHERFPRAEKKMRLQINRWLEISHEREATRSEILRTVWVLRSFVQRAGALTQAGDDIFFLSIDEILALLGEDRASLARVPVRRAVHERYCSIPPYPALIQGHFDPFKWAADPRRRVDLFAENGSTPLQADGAIVGLPGATGTVEGRVRVIATVEDGDQLQDGEILVTTVTNVGWTPMFPRAAAVVTDVGAPLSHAAIVAKELGIPAVVGCGNATMRLHTGDQVRVNGGQGTVELLQTNFREVDAAVDDV
jgi:pyruvate,water dikinase